MRTNLYRYDSNMKIYCPPFGHCIKESTTKGRGRGSLYACIYVKLSRTTICLNSTTTPRKQILVWPQQNNSRNINIYVQRKYVGISFMYAIIFKFTVMTKHDLLEKAEMIFDFEYAGVEPRWMIPPLIYDFYKGALVVNYC